MEKIAVIITAAGSGSRMGEPIPKQFLTLDGKPILAITVERIADALPEAQIIVVVRSDYLGTARQSLAFYDLDKRVLLCPGGETRYDSVKRGLEMCGECDFIAVHDGVRPFADKSMINRVLKAAKEFGAAVPAVEPLDSLRGIDKNGSVPIPRSATRAIQTPQIFRANILKRAYSENEYHPEFTDDATVAEASGVAIHLVEGERSNIKITDKIDLAAAVAINRLNK